jgi:hypothetical protein
MGAGAAMFKKTASNLSVDLCIDVAKCIRATAILILVLGTTSSDCQLDPAVAFPKKITKIMDRLPS